MRGGQRTLNFARTSVRTRNHFPYRGWVYKLFFGLHSLAKAKELKKLQEEHTDVYVSVTNVPLDRPAASVRVRTHRLPSKKIPTSPHAMVFGSNGVPQRDCRFSHLGIFPHQARRTNRYFFFLHNPIRKRNLFYAVRLKTKK